MGDVAAPRVLGRYALHAEIAAGGMASVHVGRLLGPVGFSRTVAIKRLHPQFAKDPEFVAMFLDEARIAARVRHPNVVPTLDVVASEGELFLVMEYVEGESLSRLVRLCRQHGGPPSPSIAAAVLSNALHGLHAAHEAKSEQGEPLGIVHRDVSPQNVLVGSDGIARVVDFGVAKAIGRSQVTREGQLKGKLPYMAPEQIRKRGTVSRLTDVYAASVVLWEALTARRLFDGDEEAIILANVLEGHVDPPSAHASGISKKLDAVVMRGLDQNPARRFETARDMALALEDAVSLATPTQIGEWVKATAGEGLEKRVRLVAAVEGAKDALAQTPAPEPRPDDEPTRDASTLVAASSRARPNRTRWWIALGAIVAMTLGGAIAIVATSRTPEPKSSPSASASASTAPTPSASSIEDTAVVELPPVLASAPASASHPTIVKLPTKPPTGANCVPPYYYEKGIKRFKPECL